MYSLTAVNTLSGLKWSKELGMIVMHPRLSQVKVGVINTSASPLPVFKEEPPRLATFLHRNQHAQRKL